MHVHGQAAAELRPPGPKVARLPVQHAYHKHAPVQAGKDAAARALGRGEAVHHGAYRVPEPATNCVRVGAAAQHTAADRALPQAVRGEGGHKWHVPADVAWMGEVAGVQF